MTSPRYRRDQAFRVLVDAMTTVAMNHHLTRGDVEEATVEAVRQMAYLEEAQLYDLVEQMKAKRAKEAGHGA